VRSRHRLFAILATILLEVLLASHAGARTLSVPLNIDGPRIFVIVLVNDKHARLLLDTGAGITLVEPQFAKGTTELKRVEIEQLAGISQASIRRLSVTLGELTLKDLVVGVLDMANVNRQLGTSIDGVLGENILCRFRSVRINFNVSYHGPEWLTGGPQGTEASALEFLILAFMFLAFARVYPRLEARPIAPGQKLSGAQRT
jgi:hypothetical protein